VHDYLTQYRDVFGRDEGFAWINRYVTGLLVSPNKTVQGMYDLFVFPEETPKPSRRAMHQAVFGTGWSSEELMRQHRRIIAPDYQGRRVVISFDWTYGHHERGDHIYGVKKGYDYVQHRQSRYQTVLTAVVSNRDRFDGLAVCVQRPSFEKEEKAYLEAVGKVAPVTMQEAIRRLTELLDYEAHRKAYKTRTTLFLEMIQQLEQEGHFPESEYVFDHGVLSRPLTAYIESQGKVWLSEVEQSRNIFWQGQWRRVDDVDALLRKFHPEAFRRYAVPVRSGETRICWVLSKTVRLRKYGKKRLFIVHDQEDLSDTPQFLLTNALHWEATRAMRAWSFRWTSEIFHEFGKQCTGFEAAQVRNEEAVIRHFRLCCVAQSILQRVSTAGSTSEKFAFADGKVTCGQRLKAIAREVFHTVLIVAKQLFEGGSSCDQVLDMFMPA